MSFDLEKSERGAGGVPYTSYGKNEDGEYEYNEPSDYSGMPDALFIVAKIFTTIALIIGIPFLIIDFAGSIAGYMKMVGLFTIVTIINRIFGFKI